MTPVEIPEALKSYDDMVFKNYDERDIFESLISDKDNSEEWFSELNAFSFGEGFGCDGESGIGNYFGPMVVFDNGATIPSINCITPSMIDYWETRANESQNPVLIARYSGLVIDFKQKISGAEPSIEMYKTHIAALIDIADGNFHKHTHNVYCKLKRALELSIKLNNYNFMYRCRDSIINFEKKNSVDKKPGTWGHSYDLLVKDKSVSKKIALTDGKESEIIKELEDKLERLTISSDINEIFPQAAESSAIRLAKYYQKKQKNEDVKRVIVRVGKSYYKIIENNPEISAIQIISDLQHICTLYSEFGLNEEMKLVLSDIREYGQDIESELRTHDFLYKFPPEKIKKHIEYMTSNDIDDFIQKFIKTGKGPSKKEAKDYVLSQKEETPFYYLMSQMLLGENGQIIAKVGSLEDDIEGHAVLHISQRLSFSSYFLRIGIDAAIEKFGLNKDHIIKFISNSPIISEEQLTIIEIGLDAYFKNDFIVSIHLLIPQIEASLRTLVEYGGGTVYKISRNGYNQLRTLDDLLRDPLIEESFGEDVANYLRIVLTEQRGWNIRNDVCHGIANVKIFNAQTADRILHILLLLGVVREKTDTEAIT
ncbi:DUF4209 domain-containing protein [Methanolapillus millepedarum]|uniref:DUF4209 domain-containing protein n=1 Tax=Methanolapillus millepedarum TaxID=3028296 RepID=A0AA96V206_9EURY|nr:hypothetical protein MsAc7_04730 [Methanosarcinaceae archaeon Ac7]